jgi:hypothetical protein
MRADPMSRAIALHGIGKMSIHDGDFLKGLHLARVASEAPLYEYERVDAVREKEMIEARVDAVLASSVADPEFVSLTDKADGKLPMPARNRQ